MRSKKSVKSDRDMSKMPSKQFPEKSAKNAESLTICCFQLLKCVGSSIYPYVSGAPTAFVSPPSCHSFHLKPQPFRWQEGGFEGELVRGRWRHGKHDGAI